MEYEEKITMDLEGVYGDPDEPYDPLDPTPPEPEEEVDPDKLPYPLEDDATAEFGEPEIDPETGQPEIITVPTARYYYRHEITSFPIQESHATPMNSLTASFLIPQNTVHVDVCKMDHVKVILPTVQEDESSGGGE